MVDDLDGNVKNTACWLSSSLARVFPNTLPGRDDLFLISARNERLEDNKQTQKLIDPFTEQSGEAWPNWAYGDTFVVYPGEDGPIDSIRWEVFAESLGDYALLRTAGIDPGDALLSEPSGLRRFPKDGGMGDFSAEEDTGG